LQGGAYYYRHYLDAQPAAQHIFWVEEYCLVLKLSWAASAKVSFDWTSWRQKLERRLMTIAKGLARVMEM